MKFGLEENIIKKITQVLEAQPKVDSAYIFGSRGKGSYRPDSDIDIAVKGYDLTVEDILKMSSAIDKLGLSYDVDLVDYSSLKEESLKDHIDRVGSKFYTRWKERKLGEVITLKRGYDLPRQDRTMGEIPIYSSAGITDHNNRAVKEGPGVITGRYGTIGEVFYSNSSYWPLNTTLYVKDFKENYPKFVYYLLKELDFEKYSDKSAVPGINRNEVHKEVVHMPPHSDQVQIAEILTSIDDKIDLLNHQNKTLEFMAEALFRQWFVEESKRWKLAPLGSLIDLKYGKALKDENRSNSGFPVVGSSGIVGYHYNYLVPGPGVVVGRKGTIGKVTYLHENFYPIDTTYFVKPRNIDNSLFYEYFLLNFLKLEDMNSDSAVPGLNRDSVLSMEVRIPPINLINEFNNYCERLFAKIKFNKIQINGLIKLRNELLPKLLSGEARVKMS